MIINYKKKYQETKEHAEFLAQTIALLEKENTELRWENESLKIENKRLKTIKDRLFEAGCIIARSFEDLKAEKKKG